MVQGHGLGVPGLTGGGGAGDRGSDRHTHGRRREADRPDHIVHTLHKATLFD